MLARMDSLVLTGLYQPPLWYDAVRRVPPTLLYSEPHPGNIVFPEDSLYPSLYRRLPQLKDEALHITTITEASVGRRLAERWWNEIDKDKSKDEEAAWQRVMADGEMQQLVADYDKRVAENQQTPITAGNIQRHMQAKMERMGLLRQQLTASSSAASTTAPLHSQSEVEAALDLIATAKRDDKQRDVPHPSWDPHAEMTAERVELQFEPNNRSWLVPDMSSVHQLRFVLAPPNPQLNHVYHSNASFTPRTSPQSSDKVVPPLVDNTAADDVMEWVLSKGKEQSGAALRDWIAFVLRMQIMVLRRVELAEWRPYTNSIDAQLWRQARVVLRCTTIDALEGVDMDGKKTAPTEADVAGVRDGLPMVYHEKQPAMGHEEQRKWSLLLLFVDDALSRHRFSAADLEERAPKTQWSEGARMGRSKRRSTTRERRKEARAEARNAGNISSTSTESEPPANTQ